MRGRTFKVLFAVLVVALLVALASTLVLAVSARAAFGIKATDVAFTDPLGEEATQAGSHPFAMATTIEMNTLANEAGDEVPDGSVQNLTVDLPPGFAGDPNAVPPCTAADFSNLVESRPSCSDASVLGISTLKFEFSPIPAGAPAYLHVPAYSLATPPGVAMRIGFVALGVPVTVDVTLNHSPPYNVQARATNIAQAALFYSSILTLWGDPGASAHDPLRGRCLEHLTASGPEEPVSVGECPVDVGEGKAFLVLPRSCTGPLFTGFHALAWNSGETDTDTAESAAMANCQKLGFGPEISARPSSDHAESPSGLEFNLTIDDESLSSPKEDALADSDVKDAVVTLPEGMTINPSQAEGLAVCSEAQLAAETLHSPFGAGCPAASKIGTVEVESQLLEGEVLKGSLFVAEPYRNRFGSLLAIYQVIRSPRYGILVKLAGRVEPDPRSGQIVTTFEDLPQLPFSDFRLRFREGGRSPLITPPACGTYEVKALFTPWANPGAPYQATTAFQVSKGVGGGPCPPPGRPPFEPGFAAGTLNNNAASYSPFHMRLTRRDADQDLTRFDATLPPGVVAKLAGVQKCPEAAIAALRGRSGAAELAAPACPPGSQIGTVKAGAGVGSQLTYVRGSVYLAGPFAGAPLSVLGVVPAVAGPFDVGVIATRQALSLDPITAQPRVDGERSDPIPHILAGIPLRVRDIQVDIDRPEFTLNPTSCRPLAVGAAIWGGGLDVFSPHDDAPVARSARFQAASCLNLGFKPRLGLRLKGATRRGGHPSLRAVLRPRPGEANIKRTVVLFPRATFLEQGHIRTVCTRVQFAADACPKGSVYGRVVAHTPLLDRPLRGPVYLRSSNNPLPDLVFDLKGEVEIEVSARNDSRRGRLRVTFPAIPDAPISKAIVQMQGGKKGLLVNSRNICAPAPRALVRLAAHNSKRRTLRPKLRAKGCGKTAKGQRGSGRP